MNLTNIKQKASDANIMQIALICNACFLLVSWTLFAGIPFDIFVSNPRDFGDFRATYLLSRSMQEIFLAFLWFNIVCFPVLLALAYFRKNYIQKFLLPLIFAISIFLWFNGTFLVGLYGAFDGNDNVTIDPFDTLTWIQIFTFCVFCLVAFSLQKNNNIIFQITGYILLITILTGSAKIIPATLQAIEKTSAQSEQAEQFIYSANNPNILSIMLDQYQTEVFKFSLTDDIKKELAGFIWYPDNISNFPVTDPSVASTFSANLDAFKDYKKNKATSFMHIFQVAGGKYNDIVQEAQPSIWRSNARFYTLLNFSLFRMSPDFMKPYIYNDGEWLISGSGQNFAGAVLAHLWRTTEIFKYFASQPAKAVDDYPMTFKHLHTNTTHAPVVFDAECNYIKAIPATLKNSAEEGLCALKNVFAIIKGLKEANLFDNTMIVVWADHGSHHAHKDFINTGIQYKRAAATLLIKPFNRNEEFTINDYPSQLLDLTKTFAEAINLEHNYTAGVNLLSDNKPSERERVYFHPPYNYEYVKKHKRLSSTSKYIIKGKHNNPLNWHWADDDLPEKTLPTCDFKIDFFNEKHFLYYSQRGLNFPLKASRTSVSGPIIKIRVRLKQECQPKTLRLKLAVNRAIKKADKTAQVFMNDQPIGNIRMTAEEKITDTSPKTFEFTLPELSSNLLELYLEVNQPLEPRFTLIDMELISEKNE